MIEKVVLVQQTFIQHLNDASTYKQLTVEEMRRKQGGLKECLRQFIKKLVKNGKFKAETNFLKEALTKSMRYAQAYCTIKIHKMKNLSSTPTTTTPPPIHNNNNNETKQQHQQQQLRIRSHPKPDISRKQASLLCVSGRICLSNESGVDGLIIAEREHMTRGLKPS